MQKSSHIKLSILIPVRNEKGHIELMLRILICLLEIPHEILIIYDSRNENSIPLVRKLQMLFPQVKLVHNLLGKGVTNAIKSGVNVSKGEYLLILAADDLGPALAIGDMLRLMEKGCDLVSSTRYAYGGRKLGGSKTEAFLSRTANYLFHLVAGGILTDSTIGIKVIRREAFDKIALESLVGWAVTFELAIKAQLLGMKFGEVPIISIDRLYGGTSSFELIPWLKEYVKWFLYGATHLRTFPKKSVLILIPKNF